MAKIELLRVINEHPILIPKLNLKGHIDTILFLKYDSKDIVLIIDFKTIGSYPYKLKFGRSKEVNPSRHQEMQLAIYAVAVERDFDISDSELFLVYYNKDTSMMKAVSVDRRYMNESIEYWMQVNEICKQGLPPLKFGQSPIMKWECNYCTYLDKCSEDTKKENNNE